MDKKLWIKMIGARLGIPENNCVLISAVKYAKTYKEALKEVSKYLRLENYK